jgi:hypothetical protein
MFTGGNRTTRMGTLPENNHKTNRNIKVKLPTIHKRLAKPRERAKSQHPISNNWPCPLSIDPPEYEEKTFIRYATNLEWGGS